MLFICYSISRCSSGWNQLYFFLVFVLCIYQLQILYLFVWLGPFCIYQLLSGSRRTDITNSTGNHCTKGKALPAILVSENPTHSHMFNTFNRVAFDVSAFPFELKPN